MSQAELILFCEKLMPKENGVENDDNKRMTDKMDKIMNVCNEVG